MSDSYSAGAVAATDRRRPARARWAVTAVFGANGAMIASLAVRTPSLKLDHGLSAGQLGVLSALFGVTALVAMQGTGGLVARFGGAAIVRTALVLLPTALLAVGLAGDPVLLAGGRGHRRRRPRGRSARRSPAFTVVGFAVLGLGLATPLPVIFSVVGHLGADDAGGAEGVGAAPLVARLTTMTYAGILLGPVVIGWLAEGIGLTSTLASLLPLLALVAYKAPAVAARRPGGRAGAPRRAGRRLTTADPEMPVWRAEPTARRGGWASRRRAGRPRLPFIDRSQ